ncbi:hypothetical protein KIW84_076420 [Lathyrus oleraceus]|uniref:Uncharacterized protein n=1 Tax=Pisum sativum TaxID=3888 RepID=A0A9D5A130_PEA|nr:hypothetical protein KIW84_076420 [Pisum sativum]
MGRRSFQVEKRNFITGVMREVTHALDLGLILRLDEGFTHFINDVQAEEIANHNLCSNVNEHIWVEHSVEDMLSKVLKPDVDQFSECSNDDIIDDNYSTGGGGIRFDDSEKERTCERDEGFVQVKVERSISGNRVNVNGKSHIFNVMGSKDVEYDNEDLESSDSDVKNTHAPKRSSDRLKSVWRSKNNVGSGLTLVAPLIVDEEPSMEKMR